MDNIVLKQDDIILEESNNNRINSKRFTTKFSDFGTARQNTGTLANTLARGTLIYMSPELK